MDLVQGAYLIAGFTPTATVTSFQTRFGQLRKGVLVDAQACAYNFSRPFTTGQFVDLTCGQ